MPVCFAATVKHGHGVPFGVSPAALPPLSWTAPKERDGFELGGVMGFVPDQQIHVEGDEARCF